MGWLWLTLERALAQRSHPALLRAVLDVEPAWQSSSLSDFIEVQVSSL